MLGQVSAIALKVFSLNRHVGRVVCVWTLKENHESYLQVFLVHPLYDFFYIYSKIWRSFAAQHKKKNKSTVISAGVGVWQAELWTQKRRTWQHRTELKNTALMLEKQATKTKGKKPNWTVTTIKINWLNHKRKHRQNHHLRWGRAGSKSEHNTYI